MSTRLRPSTSLRRIRGALVWLAVARGAISAVAIPLAPLLWPDRVVALVLLRPTKEVFLATGYALRSDPLLLPVVLAATVPIMVLGVWLFFALGRAFAEDAHDGELPGLASLVLRPKRVATLGRVLERKGTKAIFLGRLAVFPATLMAAAAGASGMRPRSFLIADVSGAITSTLLVLAVGYGLGEAYQRGGPWLTGAGLVLAVGLLVALGRWLRAADQAPGA